MIKIEVVKDKWLKGWYKCSLCCKGRYKGGTRLYKHTEGKYSRNFVGVYCNKCVDMAVLQHKAQMKLGNEIKRADMNFYLTRVAELEKEVNNKLYDYQCIVNKTVLLEKKNAELQKSLLDLITYITKVEEERHNNDY